MTALVRMSHLPDGVAAKARSTLPGTRNADLGSQAPPAPRVLFLGSGYAGHKTRYLNLQAHSRHDPRIRPTFRCVTGWEEG
ncbi:MAG: hypothetical protein M3442_01970, partial [Chloroflexota bacterium]|nr:hypothetical protein [Chloroflexota bacterium]